MLVRDQDRRQLQRALAENASRRGPGQPAPRHHQVAAAREHVERIRIDEAAVVVADIHDDAVLRTVVGIQIEIELAQRPFGHVAHVDVSQPPVARLFDVVTIPFDPLAIHQILLGAHADRAHHHIPPLRRFGRCSQRQLGAPVRGVRQHIIDVGARRHGRAIHRDEVVAGRDLTGNRRRSKRNHARDPEAAVCFVLAPVEPQPEPAGGWAGASAASAAAGAHAEMRRVQFADHQVE